MKKLFVILAILAGLLLTLVSCIGDDKNKTENLTVKTNETGTSAAPGETTETGTQTSETGTTSESGTETSAVSGTSDETQTTGSGIQNAGADTDSSWGEVIPIGG